jgi:F-type H+-transporting ATPase subunit b
VTHVPLDTERRSPLSGLAGVWRALALGLALGSLLATPAVAQDHEGAGASHEAAAEDGGEHAADHGGTHAAGEHGEHAEGEHGAHHGPDAVKIAALFVNFGIWIALIVYLLRTPLAEYLRSRRLAVEEGLEEAKRLQVEAQRVYDEYTEKLAHRDEEKQRLREEMIRAGEAERDRLLAEADRRAERMRKDAQFLIDQQLKQLRIDLTREAVEAAVAAAEEVLRAQASEADQKRLAEAYLESLKGSLQEGARA